MGTDSSPIVSSHMLRRISGGNFEKLWKVVSLPWVDGGDMATDGSIPSAVSDVCIVVVFSILNSGKLEE